MSAVHDISKPELVNDNYGKWREAGTDLFVCTAYSF
jgi:hypothetical protein